MLSPVCPGDSGSRVGAPGAFSLGSPWESSHLLTGPQSGVFCPARWANRPRRHGPTRGSVKIT